MRADRLLSILLLLQSRGRMSARELAERLEVSRRTLDRDLEALSLSGVPVYAVRGRKGGWELSDGYRTDLTGLTEAELRSVVLAAAPHVLAGLGLGEAADHALVKLLAALPEARRRQAERARRYIHVDPSGWRRRDETAAFVPALEEALRLGRRIAIDYERADDSVVERVLDPLGLVAKGSVWYLVAASGDQFRTYRASRIRGVRVRDEDAIVPDDFDLAEAWSASRTEFEARLPAFYATLRVAPEAVTWLDGGWLRYTKLIEAEPPDEAGWRRCRVRADALEILRALVLGLGSNVEVIEPDDLREHVRAEAALTLAGSLSAPRRPPAPPSSRRRPAPDP